jgi:hypothetical protein
MLTIGDIHDIRGKETSVLGEDKLLHAAIEYSFKIRGQGPFTVSVWREGFTAQKAIDAIAKFAHEYIAVIEAGGT